MMHVEPFGIAADGPSVISGLAGDSVSRFRIAKCWIATSAWVLASSAAGGPLAYVTAGCAGGISGGSFGVTMRRGGEIVRWHASSRHREPEEFPLQSNFELTEKLFDELDAIGVEQIDYQQTGDMTCSLSTGESDATHRVSWPIGDSEAPAKVTALAKKIRALLDDPASSEPVPSE